MLAPNQILPPLNGENDMDVNLCVGVGHICRSYGAYGDLDAGNYKDFAPTEHDLGLPNAKLPAAPSERTALVFSTQGSASLSASLHPGLQSFYAFGAVKQITPCRDTQIY